MYLSEHDENCYVVDSEANSLNPDKFWVVCYENLKTEESGTLTDYATIRDFFNPGSGRRWIGHNFLRWDAPNLNRVLGTRISVASILDTLVFSHLYNPSIPDGHSLDAWAKRLGGEQKVVHEDWSRLTPAMIERCKSDVKINKQLFVKLIAVLNKLGFTEKTCEIQHKIWHILGKQQKNGFALDMPKLINLHETVRAKEISLEEQIYHVFKPKLEIVGNYKQAYRRDGTYSVRYLGHAERYPKVELVDGGGYNAFDWVSFNLGSPDQRVKKLVELGWKPEEFTPKTPKGGGGNPKPFEKGQLAPSLERFLENNDVPEVRLIAEWMVYNGRGNMLNTWLEVQRDGYIHGDVFPAGTLRFRHSNPNTANIPAVKLDKQDNVLYGEQGWYHYESRDCWTTRDTEKRTLVGTDASSLELRMLAEELNRPAFTDQVINGKPHQYNADLVGITYAKAKRLLYAIQYAAQGPKVGKIMGTTAKEGAKIRQQFLDRLGLTEVMNAAISEQEKGRITIVDGARLVCPSPHAALNYKLQGGGARVMAQGAIFLEMEIKRAGLDSLKVGDIHDEWQYDVANRDAEEHGKLAVRALRQAGEELGMRVPIDGESKKGLTWAQTH